MHVLVSPSQSFFVIERRAAFKKTIDDTDGRRRREDTTRQIRKSKKEEQLRKRRMGTKPAEELTSTASTDSSTSTNQMGKRASIEDIPELKRVLTTSTSSMEELVEATRGFRRILSAERDPPVDAVLNAGVIPNLVHNLTFNPEAATLIFESAWALTNIASTSRTRAVVDGGAVGPLIHLLRHENSDVREQAAWCLGNIAGDNSEFRDGLLHSGAVGPLLMNLEQPANMSLLNNITWTVSNLCRGKPSPDMTFLAPVVAPLCDLLQKDISTEVKVDALWALSYLSDGPNDRIELIMQTGITTKLIEFMASRNKLLLTPTIRCIGNFVTGSDMQTQAVVDAGILEYLADLLDDPKVSNI